MKKTILGFIMASVIGFNVNAEEKKGNIVLSFDHKLGEVNGEVFTMRDWQAEFLALDPKVQAQGNDKLFQPLVAGIYEKLSMRNEAKKLGLDKLPEYQAALKKAERDIATRFYFDHFNQKMGKIKKSDLKKEYETLKKETKAGVQVKARHILVKKRNEAEKIIKALQSGSVDFVSIAKTKSVGPTGKNGGDLGWVNAGQMVPSFEKALFALKDGEISKKAVKTQFGWHIIKREESRKQEFPKFEKIKQFVEGRIRQKRAQKLIQQALDANEIILYDKEGNKVK